MSAPALQMRGIGKSYGSQRALDGMDLDVPRGSVFGLVGRNGAGKTTTFAIACGFLKADRGTVNLLGSGPFNPAWHRGRVAALPQDAALGRDMRVAELLHYLGRLQGLSRTETRSEVDRILTLVGLTDRAYSRARALSHGMLRRLGIGQAFLGRPDLVMLDEPTNGLDPAQAKTIRDFIAAQRGTRTIIVSSHNLHELEEICDHVALMDGGRVMASGTLAEVTGRNGEIQIALAAGPAPVAEVKAALPNDQVDWDESARILRCRFAVTPGRQAEEVTGAALKALLAGGARISSVTRGQSLERAYLELPDARPRRN